MSKLNPNQFFIIINIVEAIPVVVWAINFSLFSKKYHQKEIAELNFFICLGSFILFLIANIYALFLLRAAIIKQKKIHSRYITIYILLFVIVLISYLAFNLNIFTLFMTGIQLVFIFCTIGLIGRFNKKNNCDCESFGEDTNQYFYNPELPDYNEQENNNNDSDLSNDENECKYLTRILNNHELNETNIENCEDEINCRYLFDQKYHVKNDSEDISIKGVVDSDNPYSFKNREIF